MTTTTQRNKREIEHPKGRWQMKSAWIAVVVMVGCIGSCRGTLLGPNLYYADGSVAHGCQRVPGGYSFDNDHYAGSTQVAFSRVSCDYARDNWVHTPSPVTPLKSQMERDRDPKTGLLP